MAQTVDDFLSAVDRDRDLWQSVDVRILAVFAESAWRNLATYAVLRSPGPEQVSPLPHQVRHSLLRAEQRVIALNELAAFIASVQAGAWPPENPVRYDANAFDQKLQSSYVFAHGQFHSLDFPHVRPDLAWSAHVLVASGESAGTIISRVSGSHDRLQGIARQQAHPFENVDRLAAHVLGMAPALIGSRNATCEIVAPYEVRIEPDTVHLEDGLAVASVVAKSETAVRRARLQITTEPAGMDLPVDSVLPPISAWTVDASGLWRWEGRIDVGANADAVAFVLHYGAQTLQWVRREAFRTRRQPVPLALYASLDPELAELTDWLTGKGKQSSSQERLEEGVARVLVLGGLRVDRFANKRLSDGVDLVAYAPDQQLCLAIECTTNGITADGKLSKLVARAAKLREAISPITLTPVIATSLLVEGVAEADLRAAAASGVLVVPCEILLQLLALVARGEGVRSILGTLTRGGARPPGTYGWNGITE